MDRRVDPSWWTYLEISSSWYNKGRVMCYPVCGMVHINDTLLLIKNSSLCNSGSGFPLSLSECVGYFLASYVRRHIAVK